MFSVGEPAEGSFAPPMRDVDHVRLWHGVCTPVHSLCSTWAAQPLTETCQFASCVAMLSRGGVVASVKQTDRFSCGCFGSNFEEGCSKVQ